MPCYDPEPSGRDKRAVEIAGFILYVNKSLNIPTPAYVKEVATSEGYSVIGQEKHLNTFTDVLCFTLKSLKKNDPVNFEAIVYNAKSKESRSLADWWEEHEKFDNKKTKL